MEFEISTEKSQTLLLKDDKPQTVVPSITLRLSVDTKRSVEEEEEDDDDDDDDDTDNVTFLIIKEVAFDSFLKLENVSLFTQSEPPKILSLSSSAATDIDVDVCSILSEILILEFSIRIPTDSKLLLIIGTIVFATIAVVSVYSWWISVSSMMRDILREEE